MELVQRTSNLKLDLTVEFSHLVQSNQRAEFGVEVIDEEFPVLKLDLRVLSGDTDILQPDLALMPSPYLHRILIFRSNDMQTTLFLTLLPLVDPLQDAVRDLRLIDSDHLEAEVIAASGDHPREGLFADLALELGEVVRNHHACYLLLDFAVDPLF